MQLVSNLRLDLRSGQIRHLNLRLPKSTLEPLSHTSGLFDHGSVANKECFGTKNL